MATKPQNTIVILSDEHSRKVAGCYGHPVVRTPNLDQLAVSGTRFTSSYSPSPICVPARASFATGRYVNRIRCWDNAIAYDGEPASWGHELLANGHEVVSIGKLHYTRGEAARNGFSEEILPLHIVDGVGDLLGLIRDDMAPRKGALLMGPEAGPGESEYTKYDRSITEAAVDWLKNPARIESGKPWILYVGFVAPHFPLVAPEEFFDLYKDQDIELPKLYAKTDRPSHPFLNAMRECMVHDKGFRDEAMVRRALAAYYGLVSFLDDNIGKILKALKDTGLEPDTRVIYSSDHGDNLGARGMWAKSTMYEESAGVPLIVAGEGIPKGHVCDEPVTLADLYPTLLDSSQCPRTLKQQPPVDGVSLFPVANGQKMDRTILVEYHAAAAIAATYMVRVRQFKFVYYVGLPAMLFDLDKDPEELDDLGASPEHSAIRAECEAALRSMVNPEEVDAQARADQQKRIEQFGGRDAIVKGGTFRFSPPPNVNPEVFPNQ